MLSGGRKSNASFTRHCKPSQASEPQSWRIRVQVMSSFVARSKPC